MYAKVPLQGAELEEFLQKERQEKEKEAAHKAVQERKERILEADEDDDDDSDIDDDSDEENEVEMQLAGGMDVDEDGKPDVRLSRKKKSSGAGGAGRLGASDEWDVAGEDGTLSKHLSFDIYLKGNVSKSTSFFKSADGQTTQRFRMFPYIEKKRRVDEYGETIDVALWLRRDKVFQHEGRDEEREKKRIIDEDARVRLSLWLVILVYHRPDSASRTSHENLPRSSSPLPWRCNWRVGSCLWTSKV